MYTLKPQTFRTQLREEIQVQVADWALQLAKLIASAWEENVKARKTKNKKKKKKKEREREKNTRGYSGRIITVPPLQTSHISQRFSL